MEDHTGPGTPYGKVTKAQENTKHKRAKRLAIHRSKLKLIKNVVSFVLVSYAMLSSECFFLSIMFTKETKRLIEGKAENYKKY